MLHARRPTHANMTGRNSCAESLPNLSPNFDHSLESDRLGNARIKSTCKLCGATDLFSISNGCLEEWESTHQCKIEATSGREDNLTAR